MTHEDAVNLTRAINKLTKQLNISTNQFKYFGFDNPIQQTSDASNLKNTLRSAIHQELKSLKQLNCIPIIHNQLWELINRLYVFTHVIPLGNGIAKSPLNCLVHPDDSITTYIKYMKPYIDSSNDRLASYKSLVQIEKSLRTIIPNV